MLRSNRRRRWTLVLPAISLIALSGCHPEPPFFVEVRTADVQVSSGWDPVVADINFDGIDDILWYDSSPEDGDRATQLWRGRDNGTFTKVRAPGQVGPGSPPATSTVTARAMCSSRVVPPRRSPGATEPEASPARARGASPATTRSSPRTSTSTAIRTSSSRPIRRLPAPHTGVVRPTGPGLRPDDPTTDPPPGSDRGPPRPHLRQRRHPRPLRHRRRHRGVAFGPRPCDPHPPAEARLPGPGHVMKPIVGEFRSGGADDVLVDDQLGDEYGEALLLTHDFQD